MSGEFAEFGGVNPDLDPELAMALKVSAEEEQERRERQKQRQLVAGERGVIVVEDDSRDHRRTCSACPPSAMCVNGAPPVFGASKLTGSVEISVPADSGDRAVREALAAKLGVEVWQVSLPAQNRRAARTITFELVATREQMSHLGSQLEALGVTLDEPQALGTQAVYGELWEELRPQ